ncbi:MAG TPA: ABC transporter permease [Chryseosolibacter sp.]
MFFNYLKTAFRSLLRHRFFSAINIFGLAVAMCICMTMIMLVADQVSYDRYNTNADRIFRVTTKDLDENGKVVVENPWSAASSMPIAPELLANHAGIKDAVRLRRDFGNGWLSLEGQDINVPLSGFFADANTLEFFQYELQYGDANTALEQPFTVVLTRAAANKLFKEENPVGQTIKVGDKGLYTVTGVLKDTDKKSHIVFEGLASMASVKSLEESGKLSKTSGTWTDYWQAWTYVMLEEGTTEEDLQRELNKIYDQHIGSITKASIHKMIFGTQPLLSITPGEINNNSIGPQLPWEFVYFLGGLALVILLTSCFNFTNLSIARSLTRAREIGIRKVNGAMRWQIFMQFVSESVVVAAIALMLAMVMITFMKPMLLQLNFAQAFHWDLHADAMVYMIFAVFTVVVGIMAGFFPAVVLSGFQPIAVLKNLSNVRLFSRMGMRKALTVSQFTLSLFFIVTVIVIYQQLNLFTHQDHGFNLNNNIMVKLNGTSYQTLKNELQKYNNITSVSAASHVPAAGTTYGCGLKRKEDDAAMINADYFFVDEDYGKNMELKVLAGEFFQRDQGESNTNFIVINEATRKALKFDDPRDAVGEPIIFLNDSTTRVVKAVVADYNHRNLISAIAPMALLYRSTEMSVLQVAYTGDYNKASQSIEKAWAAINPGLKADYMEVKSEINKYYELIFGDLGKVLGFISFVAIMISCLGLLGMATYATETRIREISIRKVLGSGSAALVFLLSKGFMKMLAISILIGLPLAYVFNNFWLELFAYHTTIGIGAVSISIFILLVFGVITVGSQTIRATFVKPVDNLKSE